MLAPPSDDLTVTVVGGMNWGAVGGLLGSRMAGRTALKHGSLRAHTGRIPGTSLASFIWELTGLVALPGMPAGMVLFQNVTFMVMPNGGTGSSVVIADETATSESSPLRSRFDQLTGPSFTSSATAIMVSDTVVLARLLLVAVKSKPSCAGAAGIVKLGDRVSAPLMTTVGPEVWVHLKVVSVVTEPYRVTLLLTKASSGALTVTLGDSGGEFSVVESDSLGGGFLVSSANLAS